MKTLLRLSQLIDGLNERIGRAAAWFGLLAVIVCTVNATVRYALNISSNAWLELQWYLNAAMFLLVAAWTLKRNEHVRIDVIAGKLPLRAQAWIDIFGGLFMLLPAAVIIAWYSWPSLVNSLQIRSTPRIPAGSSAGRSGCSSRSPSRLLALQGVSEVIKRVAFLNGLIPYPAEHQRKEPA